MLIARWQIEARFGHKDQALDIISRWGQEIAPQVGWSTDNLRITTGSIGALESTIEVEWQVETLGSIHDAWEKMAKLDPHKRWGRELEPYVVSGTSRWQVYRIVKP